MAINYWMRLGASFILYLALGGAVAQAQDPHSGRTVQGCLTDNQVIVSLTIPMAASRISIQPVVQRCKGVLADLQVHQVAVSMMVVLLTPVSRVLQAIVLSIYTNGSFKDFYSTQCSTLSGCTTGSSSSGSSGGGVHDGRTVEVCYAGAAGNCFVNYANGSFKDFYATQCSTLAGCSGSSSSSGSSGGGGDHDGRTVSACFIGDAGNCFVNYTDGTFKDFYSTQCSNLTGCANNSSSGGSGSGSSSSSGGDHDGRTVSACFTGDAGNCFVNYTDGTFKDFYSTQCSTLGGCPDVSGSSSGGSGSGSGSSGSSSGGSDTFSPPLFRNYTASDCTYTIDPGSSYASALSSAQPGEKVCLKAGEHNGGLYLTNIQGSAGADVVLMSYPGEKAIIRGSTLKDHGLNLTNNVSYFEISQY